MQSTIDALSDHLAILDEHGTILAVNASWRHFAQENHLPDPRCGVGANYLKVCDRAVGEGAGDAYQVAGGIRNVINGVRSSFRFEYPGHSPKEIRWFQARVTRLQVTGPARVVLAHENITDIKKTEESLRRLSGRLLQLQDQERRGIARELHDTTAQSLSAVTLNLALLQELIPKDQNRSHVVILESLSLAEQCLREIRTLSYLLHPPLLDEAGLLSALRWYAEGFTKRSGIPVDLVVLPDMERLPADIESTLFRVVQECLTNIHRHAQCRRASIQVLPVDTEVLLQVRDDGHGIPAEKLAGLSFEEVGVGIRGMRERVRQLGGRLEIESGRFGTTVKAILPLIRSQR